MPDLSYSLPAFRPDGYDAAPRWLESLRALDFRWVTLHPTFPVRDAFEPVIGTGPDTARAFHAARELGFRIRLEPHLDWESTLTGGPYEWRRRMYIDPTKSYFDQVLAPLAALGPDELTLGSELDSSVYEFPGQWVEVRNRLGLGGHKLNHDALDSARSSIKSEINAERSKRGLSRRWALPDIDDYLGTLDYKAVSWYVPDWRPLPAGYVIGELGLGSTDITRPWHFDASTFQTPADLRIRQSWYMEALNWLRTVDSPTAACFWTAGHFDVLGVMDERWRDDEVVEAVRTYNQASP